MSADCFIVDVFGEFGPGQVVVRWVDRPCPPHPALDRMVAETWDRAQAEARAAGSMLFNGPLARWLGHRVEGGVLYIDAGPTDYAHFIGTNFLNPHRIGEFGREHYSNPLGTSAVVITADGWLLLGRRGPRVACHAGYIHTFGGGLEAGERDPDGFLDAFAGIGRELAEELALPADQVTDMVCLGLIQDAVVRQPELIFDVGSSRSREELEQRLRPDDPHEEHTAVLACRDAPEAIVPFILSADRIAPIAVGALCLHGRRRFGQSWYEEALRTIRAG